MRKIIHIDMDCFFAAVEMRENPQLQNIPMAVGGARDKRGVISTCNYLARQFGVRSALSSAKALELCPLLEIVPGHYRLYEEISDNIFTIFSQYTDVIQPISIDEAYLDVSECTDFAGSATRIASAIRQHIWNEHQLTASAGIAPNKFLAKVASEWRKPNGQFVIEPRAVPSFMTQLSIQKIPGVGNVTAKYLQDKGFYTCGQLQKLTISELIHWLGGFGVSLYDRCRGIDDRKVHTGGERKSLSVEHTYAEDLPDAMTCLEQLPALFTQLSKRLADQAQRKIHKQFLKIKFHDFSHTTAECISNELRLNLFEELFIEGFTRGQKPVRLLGLGVRFANAVEEYQLSL